MAAQLKELPLDIITDILCRVPVKPLFRFKLVSKSWYSLISSSSFAKLHLASATNRHLLISHSTLSSTPFSAPHTHRHHHLTFTDLNHPLKHYPKPRSFGIIGHTNGVLCIRHSHLILYNPFTHSSHLVPPNTLLSRSETPPDYDLYGFGYHSARDDYKVLRIQQRTWDGRVTETLASLYSFQTDSWKSVNVSTEYILQEFSESLLVGEVLHFLAVGKKFIVGENVAVVLRFDLRAEKFLEMFRIPGRAAYNKKVEMFELGGCLGVMVNRQSYYPLLRSTRTELSRADAWVMKEYGVKESWIKLFSIIPAAVGIDCNFLARPVVYSSDGEWVLVLLDSLSLIWYHLKTAQFERVTTVGGPPERVFFDPCCVVESLVSLDKHKARAQVNAGASKKRKRRRQQAEAHQRGDQCQ